MDNSLDKILGWLMCVIAMILCVILIIAILKLIPWYLTVSLLFLIAIGVFKL